MKKLVFLGILLIYSAGCNFFPTKSTSISGLLTPTEADEPVVASTSTKITDQRVMLLSPVSGDRSSPFLTAETMSDRAESAAMRNIDDIGVKK